MTDIIRIDLGAEVDGPGPKAGKRHGIFEYSCVRYPFAPTKPFHASDAVVLKQLLRTKDIEHKSGGPPWNFCSGSTATTSAQRSY